MKYFFKSFVAVILLTMSISSCQKVLDINSDPNAPTTSTPQLVFPAAQVELAQVVGLQWNYLGNIWAQYWTGGYGVSTDPIENYTMQSADVNTVWRNAYARALTDLKYVEKGDQPIYAGMSKILQAYLFQMLTDLHGDIPFSEAGLGSLEDGGNQAPAYDSEQDVYAGLLNMLDEGIALVNTTVTGLIEVPGNEDLLYKGNLVRWNKLANTLKLKVYVKSGDYTSALALINSGASFIDQGDDAKVQFLGSTNNLNPMFSRFEARTGVGMYFVGTAASVNTLANLGDPRSHQIYIEGSAGDEGVLSGDINANTTLYPAPSGANPNNRFNRPSAKTFGSNIPVFLVSSWESKFLQAETLTRNNEDGESLLEDAVVASFNYYGLSSASALSYVATLGFSSATTDDKLNVIGIQKWISMNGLQGCEGWLETVRFDRPGNNIFTGANGIFTSPTNTVLQSRIFPSSFVYPTDEISLNPNTPSGRTVTSKRFWDN